MEADDQKQPSKITFGPAGQECVPVLTMTSPESNSCHHCILIGRCVGMDITVPKPYIFGFRIDDREYLTTVTHQEWEVLNRVVKRALENEGATLPDP